MQPDLAQGAIEVATAGAGPSWQDFVDGWDLFGDAVLAAGVAGVVLGYLSIFIVLRRTVFVSAAVTQAAGLGVALSYWLAAAGIWAVEPTWAAAAVALGCAGVIAADPRALGLSREAVIGILFVATAAGSLLVSTKVPADVHDIQATLFGSAVVVTREDLLRLAVTAAIVLTVQGLCLGALVFASFDPLAARVQRLPVRLLDLGLLLSIGVAVGATARVLGALPTFALSTLPGVAALALGCALVPAFVVASLLGAVAGVGGYLLAFFWELPVGSTQAALAVALTIAAAPIGLLVKQLRRAG